MQPNASTLIHILRDALLDVRENSPYRSNDISACELRSAMLRAIDELEMVRTGSHTLQAAA